MGGSVRPEFVLTGKSRWLYCTELIWWLTTSTSFTSLSYLTQFRISLRNIFAFRFFHFLLFALHRKCENKSNCETPFKSRKARLNLFRDIFWYFSSRNKNYCKIRCTFWKTHECPAFRSQAIQFNGLTFISFALKRLPLSLCALKFVSS